MILKIKTNNSDIVEKKKVKKWKYLSKKPYNMEETLLNVLIDHNAHTQFNIKLINIYIFYL